MKNFFMVVFLLLLITAGVFAQSIVLAVDYAPGVFVGVQVEEDDYSYYGDIGTYYSYSCLLGAEVKASYFLESGFGFGVTFSAASANEYKFESYANNYKYSTTNMGDGIAVINVNALAYYLPLSTDKMIMSVGGGLGMCLLYSENWVGNEAAAGLGLVLAANYNIFFTDNIGLDIGMKMTYLPMMFDSDGETSQYKDYFYFSPSVGVAFKF